MSLQKFYTTKILYYENLEPYGSLLWIANILYSLIFSRVKSFADFADLRITTKILSLNFCNSLQHFSYLQKIYPGSCKIHKSTKIFTLKILGYIALYTGNQEGEKFLQFY